MRLNVLSILCAFVICTNAHSFQYECFISDVNGETVNEVLETVIVKTSENSLKVQFRNSQNQEEESFVSYWQDDFIRLNNDRKFEFKKSTEFSFYSSYSFALDKETGNASLRINSTDFGLTNCLFIVNQH